MPMPKRDPQSGAKIFVPTDHEKSILRQSRELKKSLAEVEAMKSELQSLIEQAKRTQD